MKMMRTRCIYSRKLFGLLAGMILSCCLCTIFVLLDLKHFLRASQRVTHLHKKETLDLSVHDEFNNVRFISTESATYTVNSIERYENKTNGFQNKMEHGKADFTVKAKETVNENKKVLMERKNITRSVNTTAKSTETHIAFLKVHKAASTTLQTMFLRFGHTRNLSIVLPKEANYFSKQTSNHEPLLPPAHGDHYDILCNHGYFNYTIYRSVMPHDSIYIAVVRDPAKLFISSYYYYLTFYKFQYLVDLPGNPIGNLIRYPERYERKVPLSYTMNSMARDFGFTEKQYHTHTIGSKTSMAYKYLTRLGDIFDIVLVAEYFDESIILMKRLLNWSLKDILYISKNVRDIEKGQESISQTLMPIFKTRNKLDYLVYDFFLQRIQLLIEKAGNELMEETLHYKQVLIEVESWCLDQYFGKFIVNETMWNKKFTISSKDCYLMTKDEIPFLNMLKSEFSSLNN